MMLKRTLVLLILLVLTITQSGCLLHDEGQYHNPVAHTAESVRFYEGLKRERLQLEDITVGDGPIAAAGRKVSAEIAVRYSDGTLVYQGPAVAYWGMEETVWIHNSPSEPNMFSLSQQGIILGLNGMAVGGKRRIIVPPNLVCYSGSVGDSIEKGASPHSTCMLVHSGARGKDGAQVRKLPLTVDATLIAACRPVFLHLGSFSLGRRCRDSELPKREPSDSIWRFYHAAPAKP
jgi:hypothetical protein